jgi:hypothetical protein
MGDTRIGGWVILGWGNGWLRDRQMGDGYWDRQMGDGYWDRQMGDGYWGRQMGDGYWDG